MAVTTENSSWSSKPSKQSVYPARSISGLPPWIHIQLSSHMPYYSIPSKIIAGICLFVYFTVLFKGKPRHYDGEVEDKLFSKNCTRRTERNRSEEGFHYPNQTFYDLILSKDPEEWVLQRPRIPGTTKIICICLTSNLEDKKRDEIRRSWASRNNSVIKKGSVTPIFLVGNDEEDLGCLAQEQRKHSDLLIVKTRDSYRGLVYKLLMAFRAISKVYPDVHVVKMDKDVIVNVTKVLELLNEQTSPYIVFGHVYTNVKVTRNENSPFFVPKSAYEPDRHEWYINGCFYIITARSLSAILAAAKGAKVVEVEDVFFTGILRSRTKLTLTCLPNFYVYHQQISGCSTDIHNNFIGFWVGEHVERVWKKWTAFLKRPCNLTRIRDEGRKF